MNRLKQRVILGLYYQDDLKQLSYRDVSYLLRVRRTLIRKHLHNPKGVEDPRNWPDYAHIMVNSFQRRLNQIRKPLLQRWTELLELYPTLAHHYEYELATRHKAHQKKRSRRERRARLATVNKLGTDLRWLGRFEMFAEGKTTYGYPTN